MIVQPSLTEFDVLQNGVLRLYGEKQEQALDKVLADRLGLAYTEYRTKWNGSDRSSKHSYPIHLDFELNDSCNQSCVMCPRNTTTHTETGYELGTKKKLSINTFTRIMQESSRYNLKSINLGAYAEPLTHKDFFQFTKIASEFGIIDIRMITNGILLTQQVSDEILKSSVTNIFISIDAATKETYSNIRGSGFEKVLSNVDYLLKKRTELSSKIPFIRVSFVNMINNTMELSNFLSYWHGKVDFIDVQPGEDLSENPNVERNYSDRKKRFKCISPWQRLSILANGDIIPCCSFYGRYIPIGNIEHTSLHKAWTSVEMEKVRKSLLSETSSVCETCQSSTLL